MNNEYSSAYYYRPAARKVSEPVGRIRYIHRAKAVKHNDPQGVYAAFNLSNNKGFSDKPTLDKGSAIIG